MKLRSRTYGEAEPQPTIQAAPAAMSDVCAGFSMTPNPTKPPLSARRQIDQWRIDGARSMATSLSRERLINDRPETALLYHKARIVEERLLDALGETVTGNAMGIIGQANADKSECHKTYEEVAQRRTGQAWTLIEIFPKQSRLSAVLKQCNAEQRRIEQNEPPQSSLIWSENPSDKEKTPFEKGYMLASNLLKMRPNPSVFGSLAPLEAPDSQRPWRINYHFSGHFLEQTTLRACNDHSEILALINTVAALVLVCGCVVKHCYSSNNRLESTLNVPLWLIVTFISNCLAGLALITAEHVAARAANGAIDLINAADQRFAEWQSGGYVPAINNADAM